MRFLFLIGSSLRHFNEEDISAYKTEQRFEQTLETLKSVREKVPNAYLCVFECSQFPIEEQYREKLIQDTDLFVEYYNEPGMKIIYENLIKKPEAFTFGKSLLETRGLINILHQMKGENIFSDAQRVFKLTGRYKLNDDFKIKDYESRFLENHYVIKTYEYLQKEMDNVYAYLYGAKGMMVTGLWSFDRILFNDTLSALEQSFDYMERMLQYTSGTDIEHALYRFLNHKNILRILNLGLNVNKGMNGETYSI
jgi:hypothetical protein